MLIERASENPRLRSSTSATSCTPGGTRGMGRRDACGREGESNCLRYSANTHRYYAKSTFSWSGTSALSPIGIRSTNTQPNEEDMEIFCPANSALAVVPSCDSHCALVSFRYQSMRVLL